MFPFKTIFRVNTPTMRLNLVRLSVVVSFLFLFIARSNGQSCLPTGINGRVINLSCNQICSTLVFQVPHLKSTEDYTLVSIPYTPFPYTTPTGVEDFALYADDQYSFLITLPFSFCFYGNTYNNTVVGSNGIMTFDPANASCANAWPITTTIPYAGGTICSSASTYYPKASIMGAYADLDPRTVASPATRKIQWDVTGTAPCRKFVVSFYNIGVFNNSCGLSNPHTFQMVIHESTGIVDINTQNVNFLSCGSSTNSGNGIQGIQDFSRTKAVAVPGRNNARWSEQNASQRFVPSGATSFFQSVQLLDMGGAVVATGDTLTTTLGLLDLRFTNFCTTAGTNQYVVKTIFTTCDGTGFQLTSLDTITINRTNLLNATASATAATCGPPDGTITVTVPAGVGTPPYTYTLDGGAPIVGPSPYTFTGVSSGPHVVTVTDASGGCTSTINITVTLNGVITETHTTTATACVGVNNGKITILTAGGIGPNYSFVIDGGPPVTGTLPYTFSNLSAGGHTIQVIDLTTGCNTGLIFILVPNGPGITGTAFASPASCVGVNNGSLIVTATTGIAPFTWSLDGAPYVPGASPITFNNLAAGSHSVIIRDANNCSILVFATVPTGPGVSGTATPTATSCPTANNGSILVTATSGTAPFTWSLDGGAFVAGASPYTFSGVAAGAHTVTIKDVNNCTILIPVTITAGAALTATTTTTQTSCAAAANGSITIDNANGTGPYSFVLDGGAPQAGTIPYTFNNVAAGGHTIVVTDATGCSSAPIPVTVIAGAGITGTATPTATTCPTATNGSILVNATSGASPFTWSLDGAAAVPGANPYTFNNVAAGTHTVDITDNVGCSVSLINIVVSPGAALTATTSAIATSCSGASNGSITVTPVGGTAPFTFAIDGGAPQAGTVPYTFTNLASGSHNIIVADAVGCVTNTIIEIVPAGPNLTTTVTQTAVLCNGGSTGSINITVPTIGTPPYQYSLDGVTWVGTNIFNGLPAGNYTAYYRESNGCQGSTSVTVSEPTTLAATNNTIPVVCNGQNNGTITINASGGVGPYQYSIDGGATWVANNVFNVAAGSYTVLIRDVNNCSTTQSMIVTQPLALTGSVVTTQASCNGGNNGTITANVSGGNSNYQYSIDGGANWLSSNSFNVAPGNYTVDVKDALGCTISIPAIVGLGNNLNITPQADAIICEGSNIQLNLVSNATQYSWAPSTGLSSTSVSNPVANPTVTTQYIVTATLQRCAVNDTVNVFVNPAPVPDAGGYGAICFGQSYQLRGSGGVRYSWTPNTFLDNPAVANPIATPTRTIVYTLSIMGDINNCPSLVTDTVSVDVTPPIRITTFPFDTILYENDLVQLLAVSAVPAANNFIWTPVIGLSNPAIPDPILTAGPVGDVIQYKVTATSAAGCKGEGFVKVKVYKGPELYVPTAFTPNGDGLNDRFYPFPVGIKSINYFRVYNRWGQIMFNSTTLYQGWDGKYSGVLQPNGVYVYMAEGVDKNGNKITKKGTITLIK